MFLIRPLSSHLFLQIRKDVVRPLDVAAPVTRVTMHVDLPILAQQLLTSISQDQV